MNQLAIDWDADVALPVSGLTPAAKEASASAAQAIAKHYSERIDKVLMAFRSKGRLTIAEAAHVCAMKEQSICSVFGKLKKLEWITGTGEFFTYTITRSGREWRVKREFQILTPRGLEAASYFRSKA